MTTFALSPQFAARLRGESSSRLGSLVIKALGKRRAFGLVRTLRDMMLKSISNYLENKLLDATFNNTSYAAGADPYISLHTANPGETGTSEATGGSYARVQAAFGAASSGAVVNSGNIDFTGMPAVTVTHVGVWDDPTAGNHLWNGPLTSSVPVSAGATFRIATSNLTVSLD